MSTKKRAHNIIFHTHTVSGIVISVALYIIFFAGSFSFFRDEIVNWERGHTIEVEDEIGINVDSVIQNLSLTYPLYGRDIDLHHYYNERKISVSLSASKDSTAPEEAKVRAFFYMDTHDHSTATYQESYTLGEFLYRLHFFAQIPNRVGYYLSGFVAFFFLFAILTGIIIHWKKIISSFYVFRPWAKLKTIWTDSHTALGLIGFPFQLVYALTGSFFMLKTILVIPAVLVLYNGDQEKFSTELEYHPPAYELGYEPFQNDFTFNDYLDQTRERWGDFKITEVKVLNYGDVNMHVSIAGNMDYDHQLNGIGEIIYKVSDHSIVKEKSPLEGSSYLDGVKNLLFRLHFADFAGIGMRIISFVLGLVSCYVILSGVMIWLVARDKKNVSEKQRRFNQKVVYSYLAICLSMFPVIALEFVLVKLIPQAGMSFIYWTFFAEWLGLSIFFTLKKDNVFTLKWSLILGSIFGLMIPVVNGIITGNWFWRSWQKGFHQILIIDLFWILLSAVSLFTLYQLKIRKTPKIWAKNKKYKTVAVAKSR
ncbi:PepSY-associated TM helix domain-containing protein [Flexithrix dorotheae]|uniref:PepSY-associated TM helix domain-containing protein n=1 Tax=Flexithrix dorotheae TaxID=70993 RepID=UPI0004761D5A|nr:PepSY-associated TM helix domain-containing protein [Flexithrix dorotheae]